ncbi:MAG TPA: glycosyltransferase [Pirellulaceae bacterium]|nr:glycosyltransferase [Pirellulaceae bacterium]
MIRHLLDDCDVHWINTIGTRSPRLNWGTLSRAYGKLRDWTQRKKESPQPQRSPRVLNPAMWPGFRAPWQRNLNRRLIAGFLKKQIPRLSEATLLTTVPIVADALDSISVQRSVYYCVDDFSAWPGLDSAPLRELERDLVGNVDCIVAAGENLAERMRQMRRSDVSVLTHGLDLAHWTQSCQPDALLRDVERPIALFWGLVDRRLDIQWLQALGRSMTSGTIVLVGPEQDPDPALANVPRLRRLGAVPYDRLPAIAAGADVLIMPYADSPVTRAMQPLKLKEYLATGKPVVARRLPAVKDWEDCLDTAATAEEFCTAFKQCVSDSNRTSQQSARQRLSNESWTRKAEELRGILFGDSLAHGEQG